MQPKVCIFAKDKLVQTRLKGFRETWSMARKKNKQMGAVSKEPIAGQESLAKTSTLSPGDAAGGGGDVAVDRLPKTNQAIYSLSIQ